MAESDELQKRVERQAQRMKKAELAKRTVMAQTVYLGTLGLVLVLPVLVGAYLGRWLDEKFPGYSVHWTVSLILVGVFVGAMNVYFFIRDRG